MATAMETVERAIQGRSTVGRATCPSAGFASSLRKSNVEQIIGNSVPKTFEEQREIILNSIHAHAKIVNVLAERIVAVKKPSATDSKEYVEYKRFEKELKAISVANIKLFVEINAYKSFLTDIRDSLPVQFPDTNDVLRIGREKQINELVEELGKVANASNNTMKELGESKEEHLCRVPMNMQEIRSLNLDMLGIKDASGEAISERLGRNIIAFENVSAPASVLSSILEDQKEISERLDGQDKQFLERLAVIGGYMFSIDVIRQLSEIDVRLGIDRIQRSICTTELGNRTVVDMPDGTTVRLSDSETQSMAANIIGARRHVIEEEEAEAAFVPFYFYPK